MAGLRICALGSSFAAGPGLKPGSNYPSLLAKALGADLQDASSSGSTLDHIDLKPQSLFFRKKPPQLSALQADTDIVTITSGGNDLGYSAGQMWDSIIARLNWFARLFGLKELSPRCNENELMQRVRRVIRSVKQRAPDAQIYLVEYLNVFGPLTRSGTDTVLSRERIQHYIEQSQVLSRSYSAAAADFERVHVIRVSEISQGHELGSGDPWVFKFLARAPYHPNAAGHMTIMRAILAEHKARAG